MYRSVLVQVLPQPSSFFFLPCMVIVTSLLLPPSINQCYKSKLGEMKRLGNGDPPDEAVRSCERHDSATHRPGHVGRPETKRHEHTRGRADGISVSTSISGPA
jgi:hypothetical protein